MTEFEKFAMNNFLIYGKNLVRIEDVEMFYNEYRTTKRALWLAREERALERCKFYLVKHNTKILSDSEDKEWDKWIKVSDICEAKAEEYK